MNQLSQGIPHKLVLKMALIGEGALVLVSLGWAWLRGFTIPCQFSADLAWAGIMATGPLLAFNFGVFAVLANRHRRYNVYHEFKQQVIIPLCTNLTVFSAFVIALSSGIGEELFFRGILNLELSKLLTPLVGIALASFLFSYVHFIGAFKRFWQLIIFYFLFGLYFSYVVIRHGDIMPAIIAHALYNFIAMIYIRYYEVPRQAELRAVLARENATY